MIVNFYKFPKKPNSTAIPYIGDSVEAECILKDEVNFLNPTLRVNTSSLVSGEFSPSAFNYAQISYWQRFYYITDWVYLNGMWECSLSVDVLASFKYDIGRTESYIIRSSNTFNGNIIDDFYPATTRVDIQKIQISSEIYHTSLPSGCYILGCINNDTSIKVGSVTYYALDATQMAQLLAYLFSGSIYNDSGITEIGEGLFKSLFDPFQYVVSCIWMPFPASSMGTETAPIKVGYWTSRINATLVRYIVTDPIGFKSNLPIPLHPQSDRGDYMNRSPFTRLTAYYPPFGEIPVDTSFCQYGDNNYLYGKLFVDYITGVANAYFSITNGIGDQADPYKYFTMRTAQIGVPIQLSQVATDYLGMATGVLGGMASLATRNIGGAFESLKSGFEASLPKMSTQGANGSFVEITEPPYLIVEHYNVVNDNVAEFGRPLCENRVIGTIPGYIKCGGADHEFNCTRTESEQINSFLKTGFYYE